MQLNDKTVCDGCGSSALVFLTRDNGHSKRAPRLNFLTTHGLGLQAVVSDDLELHIDDSIALSHDTATLSAHLSVTQVVIHISILLQAQLRKPDSFA